MENKRSKQLLEKKLEHTISPKERENRKCQMNHMPKKYWKNMLEMSDNYEKSS